VDVLIFYVPLFGAVYLDGTDFVIDPAKERQQILCQSRKSATETLTMISQAFREENMNSTQKVQTHRDGRSKVKSKVKSMNIIFFDIMRIVHKGFVLAGQTVNSAYYCDILRRLLANVRRLRSELWWQHHGNTRFTLNFSTGNSLPKQPDSKPPPTLISSVSPNEDKTEKPPF
jgi:hypothetical protein